MGRIGELCGNNPLALQRTRDLWKLTRKCDDVRLAITRHEQKCSWHISRIYRERNRIVHQASPSQNVETLIQNLCEYYLTSLQSVFETSDFKVPHTLDDVFSDIHIKQEYRMSQLQQMKQNPISVENASFAFDMNL